MAATWQNLGNANASATGLVAITKSDSTDLTALGIRAVYVGATGDVAILAVGDTVPITFVACPVGYMIPVFVAKVYSTGTSASSLVGLI